MKKRVLALFLSMCMTIAFAACSEPQPLEEGEPIEPVYTISPVEEPGKVIGGKEDFGSMKDGINDFSFRLYDALPKEENCFYSPYSLCSALSMLNVGADGETKQELESALGIVDFDAWNQEMQAYLSRSWTDDTYVITGNSVWLKENKEWSAGMAENFTDPLKKYYAGEVREVDFAGAPDAALKEINDWTNDHTNGMIPSVLSRIPDDTAMILLNAVYFQGKWSSPFLMDDTFEDIFHGTEGDQTVEMMHQYGNHFRYMDNGSIKGIVLPYKGDSIVMKIFIPSKEEDLIGDLFGALDSEEKQALLDSLNESDMQEISTLQVPKFTDERELEGLDDILKSMGIRSAYTDSADFHKIADDISVTTVVHKAKVIVDEQGTKAAAVTGIVANETAMMEPEPVYDFIVDRPFVYVIEDADSGMILFMGQVNQLQ
ncbi:MAG: serpin family protein [Lachnospiraceae bacterium]